VKTCALLVLAAALVALGGCGDESGGGATTTVEAYFLRDGAVWPVAQEVDLADDEARAALEALEAGPADDAADALEAETAVEEGSLDLDSLAVSGGVARVSTSAELTPEAEAQIVYTLSALPDVESVELDGTAVTTADYEEQTPSVLVESPLPFEQVSSPLVARGTANTFEATFSFEILDSEGEVLADDFVTATSGTGTRGTFELSQPFVVEGTEAGTLVVFELSAEDGSRIHEVEIPLELQG
jgi:hypothetical protein